MNEQTPHNTADMLGITPVTLRRWCEYHAAHLSPGANPPSGQARRFSGRDIEVFKTVKQLRDQGLTVARINEQLATLTFAEVETSDEQERLQALPAAQEGLQQTPAPIVAHYDLEKLVEALERSRAKDSAIVRSGLTMFALGFCAACLLFFILVYLVSIYAR